jgi:prolyl 4-hydroxylase
MEYKEIGPGLRVYSNAVKDFDDKSKDIRAMLESEDFEWHDPRIIRDGQEVVDYHVRKLRTAAIEYDIAKNAPSEIKNKWEAIKARFGNILYNSFTPIEEHYKQDYAVHTRSHDVFSILNYGEEEFFSNHLDDCLEFPRTISVIYYLNDDYDGGEIVFPRFGVEYKPNANELLVFPSSYVYNHSVNQVKNGRRYAVVSWLD